MTAPTVHAGDKEVFLLSKHRLEGLSDALFAIVMTLLVLDLKVPDLGHDVTARQLFHALGSMWRVYFSLFVTFALSSVFWMFQQTVFRAMRKLDRAGTLLSLLTLLFVSLLPFSAAILARYLNSAGRAAQPIYFANQFAIAGLLALLWRRTVRCGNLEEIDLATQARFSVRIYSLALACFAAVLISVFNSAYAFFGFAFVMFLGRMYQKKVLHL
ncbi:MAG TPA: TMEM175 family protein [Candidatus Sulfotelmatobacter sp.]|jgi:uncharacterized membrane protein|nr:TMEM175 family protein [Candidatus Sulfotelmatobacter sp.]